MLLRTLRGEHVDWDSIEKKHTPSRACTGCGFVRFKDDFALSQWRRKDEKHFCIACVGKKITAGTPLECLGACGLWKAATAFTTENAKKTVHRVCKDCEGQERRRCQECELEKGEAEFEPSEWRRAQIGISQVVCSACSYTGKLTCANCTKRLPKKRIYGMAARAQGNTKWKANM